MTLDKLINTLNTTPELINFSEVMTLIDQHYDFHETAFSNGQQKNAKGENSGSCKIFSFAKLHQLSESQTLALFGEYYRTDVLQNPDAQDHQNIREFMQHGYAGLSFEGTALSTKNIA